MFPITHEGYEYTPDGAPRQPVATQPVTCDLCGAVCTPTCSIDTGYAYLDDVNGHRSRLCYTCAADFTRQAMTQTGRAVLYINEKEKIIKDWTGQVSFPAAVLWHGKHNWYCVDRVTYARFIGPDGAVWSGKQLGDYNELFYCKRTKIDPAYIRY